MRLASIKEKQEDLFDVVVSSKIGRYADFKNLPYREAKPALTELVGQYQSDIFPEDPLASMEWKNNGNAAVIELYNGDKIFFYLMRANRQ